MTGSTTGVEKKIHEAQLAYDLRVFAQVSDAHFNVSLKRGTDVIAEEIDGKLFAIAAQYGPHGTAIATVARQDLIFT